MRIDPIVRWVCATAAIWASAGELQVQRKVMDNGITVFLVQNKTSPFIHSQIALKGGAIGDPQGASGTAALFARVIEQGLLAPNHLAEAQALAAREESLLDALASEEARQRDQRLQAHLRGAPEPPASPVHEEIKAKLAKLPVEWNTMLHRADPPLPLPESLAFPPTVVATHQGIIVTSRFQKSGMESWCQAESRRLMASNPVLLTSLRSMMEGDLELRGPDSLARLTETTSATAFLSHPYGRPVEGWPMEAAALRWMDVEAFRKSWVLPSQIAITFVGDLDWSEIEPALKRSFGVWRTSSLSTREPAEDPAQKGERRVILEINAPATAFQVAWHVPGIGHPDQPALEMLAGVLGTGTTSRLHRDLVDSLHIASFLRVDSGNIGALQPGLFSITVQAKGETGAGDLGAAVVRAIEQIREQPPSPDELERVIALAKAKDLQTLDDPSLLAEALSKSWIDGGDPAVFTHRIARLEKVTGKMVREVAQKYLIESNRTVSIIRRPSDIAQSAESKQIDETLRKKLRELIGRQYPNSTKADEAVDTQMIQIRQLPLQGKKKMLMELEKRLAAPQGEGKK